MMNSTWQQYSEKFLNISPREQYLIIFTGLVTIVFVFFSFAIDANLVASAQLEKQIKQTMSANNAANTTINVLEQALLTDPNVAVSKRVTRIEQKILAVDSELLELTSGLINPIQMRYALVDLLKLQSGVSLTSFEVIKAIPLNIEQATEESTQSQLNQKTSKQAAQQSDEVDLQMEKPSLTLYKHGIKLILKGDYFQLRDYLVQLEQLEWQFFWQQFNYQLVEYPTGELHVEMYSLSTNQEFIGV